ncbi:aldose 1-epimerase family protein [Azotosporobacter soli]|uniref:aldose 1-epimerase family protein n=1 Tax=Azotosporobacter soli TaxID=3055040 RepID=UPI0031FEBC02
MITTLKNDFITASLDSLGAELTSLRLNEDGSEYLWQADAAHWGRHAPVLFPIVGRLRDNRCRIAGESYAMTQHGFARDMEFSVVEQSPDAVTYCLKADAATLKKYPYHFALCIEYRLCVNAINVAYRVENKMDTEMFFSIGAHPAFNCPLVSGETFADYYLEFEKMETIGNYLLEHGLLRLETKPLLKNEAVIGLNYPLFANDALVFKGLQSRVVSLKSRKSDKSVKVMFEGFPYLGIWSKEAAPFICLEPWYGVADLADEERAFEKKEGMQKLAAHETFRAAYRIEIR